MSGSRNAYKYTVSFLVAVRPLYMIMILMMIHMLILLARYVDQCWLTSDVGQPSETLRLNIKLTLGQRLVSAGK